MASWKTDFYATEATTGFVATWVTTSLKGCDELFLKKDGREESVQGQDALVTQNFTHSGGRLRGKRETMRNIEKWIG